MGYMQELDAIQRWSFQASGIKSLRLTSTPPQYIRPVIQWEAPSRQRDRYMSRYVAVNRVRQYGKFFAASLEELYTYQDLLTNDLEVRLGVIPVYDREGPQGVQIAVLKRAFIEWIEGETLDVAFNITYESYYGINRPIPAPAPRVVANRWDLEEGGQ